MLLPLKLAQNEGVMAANALLEPVCWVCLPIWLKTQYRSMAKWYSYALVRISFLPHTKHGADEGVESRRTFKAVFGAPTILPAPIHDAHAGTANMSSPAKRPLEDQDPADNQVDSKKIRT